MGKQREKKYVLRAMKNQKERKIYKWEKRIRKTCSEKVSKG